MTSWQDPKIKGNISHYERFQLICELGGNKTADKAAKEGLRIPGITNIKLLYTD